MFGIERVWHHARKRILIRPWFRDAAILEVMPAIAFELRRDRRIYELRKKVDAR